MNRLNIDDLKKIQIQILDHVAKFCDEEGINYWIDSGTLLGAVRHGGYIPWDDDIDLGMLRKDYEKFVSKFNKYNKRYKCCTMENTEKFPFAFAKVMDLETELYEPNKLEGIKMSINIDIFVYDNAPDDEIELDNMYTNRDKNIVWYRRRILPTWHCHNKMKKILNATCFSFLKLIPVNFFIKRINDNITKYNNEDTKYVGNFTAETKMRCSKDVFQSFIDINFEGKLYKAPVGYDKWLKSFYGDYMKLPPEEKRISNHKFEAYKK